MKFPFSISHSTGCWRLLLIFIPLGTLPVNLQAETVYITDSLFIGLHKERSIDSEILKVLPTGTALEVIKRDNEFVNVRDTNGVSGWISERNLVSHDPNNNEGPDENSAQSRIRKLETELQNIKLQQVSENQDLEQDLNSKKIEKLKIENKKLKQQASSNKLKSGVMQANLAELRNQISQRGSNSKLINKVKQLTETNAQLKDEIGQLQKTSNTDSFKLSNPVIFSGIALLLGLLVGIIFMDRREKHRYGGLRL